MCFPVNFAKTPLVATSVNMNYLRDQSSGCFCKYELPDRPLKFKLNTFVPNAPFPTPLKTSEYLTVFWCF